MKPEKEAKKPAKPANPAAPPKPADGEKVLDPKRAEPKPKPRLPFISEDRIDREDEASFPASDPPSYSPTVPK
jgi:hypothetical protein